MSLTKFFRLITAPDINPGATADQIAAAEVRLGGRFPSALRAWFREANGFDGQTEESMWRFPSVDRLQTVTDVFAVPEFTVSQPLQPARLAAGHNYVIICHALIYLPFYAVNIRPENPCYAEVLCGLDCTGPGRTCPPVDAWLATPSFAAFADWLFEHPADLIYDEGWIKNSTPGTRRPRPPSAR